MCKHIFRIFSFIILFILLSIVNSYASEKDYDYGLKFLAHTVNQDQRTGLDLTPERSLKISDKEFTLSFQLKLRKEKHTYGYVFRLISKDESSFDLISHLAENRLSFLLNNKGEATISKTHKIDNESIEDKWLDIQIKFLSGKTIALINKVETTIDAPLSDFKELHVLFGSNKYLQFSTTDVAPMSIRNIEIQGENKKLIRNWSLSQYLGNETFDSVESDKAIVTNGSWEIDKHYQWSKVQSFSFFKESPQITEDTITGRVFMATQKYVYVYHIKSNTTDTIKVQHGTPYLGVSRRIIYDNVTNRLISYALDIPELNIFDFTTNTWSQNRTENIDRYQHQNHIIDYNKRDLITFGGYGRHMYISSLSKRKLDEDGLWDNKDIDTIHPRYLSAMGQEDDRNILILGGYGSASGKQEEWAHNYYDLYRINIDTYETTKLWEYTNQKEHYTFSNSMIVDRTNNKIYALAYNNDRFKTRLQLCSFDIETNNPSPLFLGDTIPYDFLDIKSYSTIFLDNKSKTLYAMILQGGNDIEQTVDIYSLSFPPITKDAISPFLPNDKSSTKSMPFLMIVIGLIILILICLFIYNFYHKKRSQTKEIAKHNDSSLERDKSDTFVKQVIISSIYLIGGFRVIDKNGFNITREFTPTLKSVFLFLLLNSIKREKGTTSQQLDETFWFDMDKDKAVNNRSVNVRRLRLLLEKIGDIDVVNKSGYWLMSVGESVFCDYKELMGILGQKKHKEAFTIDEINTILDLASGDFLSATYDDWLDKYKSDYSILITETLISISRQNTVESDYNLLLKISDIILANDNIDEDAIKMKVQALYKMKKKGLSKKTFDQFYSDYVKLLGSEPSFTYEEIIKT